MRFLRTSPSVDPPSQGSAASRSSSPSDLAAYRFAATCFVVPSDTTLGSSVGRPVLVLPRGRLPQAWLPSQGSSFTAGQGPSGGPDFPSWGSSPLQWRGRQGPLFPGLPHPARSAREVLSLLDGFLPCHLTASGGHRHSWGFLAPLLGAVCPLQSVGLSPAVAPVHRTSLRPVSYSEASRGRPPFVTATSVHIAQRICGTRKCCSRAETGSPSKFTTCRQRA
jgi:hypothetical protein